MMFRTFVSILCFYHSCRGQDLAIEPDFLKAAKRLPKVTDEVYQSSALFANSKEDVMTRARELRKQVNGVSNTSASNVDPRFDVSSVCLNHTEMFLSALAQGQTWALRIVDAIGKPPSGLMNYRLLWLGDYDECVETEAAVNKSGVVTVPYKGRYCKASFKIAETPPSPFNPKGDVVLTIGVCVPNSCSETDTAHLINTLLSFIPLNTSSFPPPIDVLCQYESLTYSAKAIAIITVCSVFALVMVVATAYDVIVVQWFGSMVKHGGSGQEGVKEKYEPLISGGAVNSYGATNTESHGHISTVNVDKTHQSASQQQGILIRILLSFSVYTNGKKILSVSQPSGTLTAVNGIRFISMTWVILGHAYFFGITAADNLLPYFTAATKRFTFQAILNATVSVDTFFTLSGLLVTYLSLREMKKTKGARHFKWGMFYFHRFWRLTPPYMLFLMFYVPLIKYWSNGPLWSQTGIDKDECEGTWWRNLLYINNFFPPEKMCMGWSWYLANDMQFYVVTPLIIIPFYYSSFLGAFLSGAFLLTCFISTGVISSDDNLGAGTMGMAGEGFEDIYIRPWTRIGPYVVGALAGYILYKTDCKIRIPKFLNLLGWVAATTIALLVLYGLYDSSGQPHLSVGVSAFYNATHRSAWGMAVCWVIVACATGHGGWVNTLLSWKALVPLSRLTYCAYLVHPVVMDVYFMSRKTLVYYTDVEISFLFCGFLVMSYAVAFVVSLAFESPMMGLEKVLLGRGKNS